MSKEKSNDIMIPIQLELFSSTQQLNLSEVYEAIPKEVSPHDPSIVWKADSVAMPVERPFTFNDKTMVTVISPAMVKERAGEDYVSRFPHFRESRIEYAILTLASKDWLQVHYE